MKYQEVYRMVKQAMIKEAFGSGLVRKALGAIGNIGPSYRQGAALNGPANYTQLQGEQLNQPVPKGAGKSYLQEVSRRVAANTPGQAGGSAIVEGAKQLGNAATRLMSPGAGFVSGLGNIMDGIKNYLQNPAAKGGLGTYLAGSMKGSGTANAVASSPANSHLMGSVRPDSETRAKSIQSRIGGPIEYSRWLDTMRQQRIKRAMNDPNDWFNQAYKYMQK